MINLEDHRKQPVVYEPSLEDIFKQQAEENDALMKAYLEVEAASAYLDALIQLQAEKGFPDDKE